MQQNRVLIIVLVVLVIVFLVGIVGGATQGGNSKVSISSIQSGFFGTLHNLFVHPQPLAARDVRVSGGSPACLQGNELVIPQGGFCRYTITQGGSDRTITPGDILGSNVSLTLDPEGAMRETLNFPSQNRNLDVFNKGGSLTVVCITGDGSGNCRVTLQ